MADFEKAIESAFEKQFDGIEITGCGYHFGEANLSWLFSKIPK